jgi:SAM-dependent methyltransferase
MTAYIMDSQRETERLRFKTESVLVRRHLAWSGLRPGDSFVDFGCGTGEVIAHAAHITRGARVVGVDGNRERLLAARQTCLGAGALDVELHQAEIAGVGSSSLAADSFDHAWSRFFLEYQPDPNGVVRELARVVRPGGKLTLIDIEGNGIRHFGMPAELRCALDEILADLAETGFDPDLGAKLPDLARAAGLIDIRHEIEPYHRIVGAPDARTLAAWERKLTNLRESYVERLFPHKAARGWAFAALLEFLERDDTMTWSLLHLVQGTIP